jgi:hypothetical protein
MTNQEGQMNVNKHQIFKSTFRKLAVGLGVFSVFALTSMPAASQAVFQKSDVFEFFGEDANGAPTPENPGLTGAAWLNRTAHRIQGRVMTKVDKAGHAYTVWIVLFNNPLECDMGCNDGDLENPDVEPSVYYGNGAISSLSPPGGVINLDLALTDEGLADGRFRLDDALPEPIPVWVDGLTLGNGLCAEIHLVVDVHETPKNKMGRESWVPDLTTTVFPGTGGSRLSGRAG